MMARRSSHRRRSRRDEGIPWVVLSLFIVGVTGVVALLVFLYLRAVDQHPATSADLCPESGAVEQTIVLVDATDKIAPITQTEIMTRVTDLANSTKKWARFELRVLTPGSERTNTLFSRCNPGDGSELDEYTGNPEMARKKWASQFSGPLRDAMARSMAGEGAETSPIMAGVQQIAVERMSSEQAQSVANTVIVVSDMLENSEYFSVYQSGPDFEAFRASPAHNRFASNLAGANVAMWFVERETKVSSVQLVEFWMQWILENRGNPLTAYRLQGMQ